LDVSDLSDVRLLLAGVGPIAVQGGIGAKLSPGRGFEAPPELGHQA
jgi:hypothetical protein